MPIDPAQLLKRLEPAVRPASVAAPGRVPLEQQSFDELLTLVARGEVRSDRPVQARLSADDAPSDAQLARLAAATDEAEAHGVRRAVMFIDGRAMVMDVPGRTIETELTADTAERIVPIDAAVFVPDEDEAQRPASPAGPHAPVVPRAVAEQLESARHSQQPSSQASLDPPPEADRSVA